MIDFTNAVFLDTETTRKEPTDGIPIEVIELGWIRVPNIEEGGGASGFSKRYKPRFPPQIGAIAVHGILMEDLQEKEASGAALGDVPKVDYWIGHNIDFDWEALDASINVRRICTLALARRLWPDLDSHTLAACLLHCEGATKEVVRSLRAAHSAAWDVVFVTMILKHMLAHPWLAKAQNLEQLWQLSEEARIPTHYSFGKFRGLPISAGNRGYAHWYAKQEDPDPYVLEAFRREGWL